MGIYEILGFAGSALGFIGCASIISGIVLRRFDKLEKKLDRRENDRIQESVMRGELLSACDRLCEANTHELQMVTDEDACNRELENLQAARSKLEGFMRAKSTEYLHTG